MSDIGKIVLNIRVGQHESGHGFDIGQIIGDCGRRIREIIGNGIS